MDICVNTYMFTYTLTHTHIHTHTHFFIYYMYIYITYIYVHIFTHICTYMYIYVYIYEYSYICIYGAYVSLICDIWSIYVLKKMLTVLQVLYTIRTYGDRGKGVDDKRLHRVRPPVVLRGFSVKRTTLSKDCILERLHDRRTRV